MAIDFPLNSATAGGQQRPAVLIFARQIDAAAAPVAPEFRFLRVWAR
jgi:hypothetical protein